MNEKVFAIAFYEAALYASHIHKKSVDDSKQEQLASMWHTECNY